MDIKEFYRLIEKPTQLDENQAAQLDKIIKEFPYFSSARLVKILNLIKTGNNDVFQVLEDSSLYLYDKKKIIEDLIKFQNKAPENLKSEEKNNTTDGNQLLPETAVERKDFTDEILNELSDLGKGIKATVLEEFKSEPSSTPPAEKKEKESTSQKPDVNVETKDSKTSPDFKEGKSLTSNTTQKPSTDKITSPQTSKLSEPKESQAPKKDLADEVMENIARMREERELRKKNEAAQNTVKPISKPETKNDNKGALKKEVKANKKLANQTKKTAEKTNSSSVKAESQAKSVKNQTVSPKNKEDKTSKKAGHDKKIIESFINSEIKIKPRITSPGEEPKEDLSKPSTELPSNLVSENLANIFEKQGKNSKAIAIYKELILKYPEKKSYFAAKIQNLEK